MDKKYLLLLAQKFPTIDSAASEIVNLSAIRSMPKGTEYFFSDIHGEYEAFLHMLKSASGMIKNKIDLTLGKTVSSAEREALAYLIYYPDKQLKRLRDKNGLSDEWRRLTIYRLILVCEAVSAKYTRSRVRKSIPKDMVYILDELLNVTDDVVKEYYYDEIITTILDTGIADRFIKSLCELIQSLAIDKLHIIGDIYDRGPRADIIMDELMKMHDVDIQWGNHDISWMGAASGNLALIANVIRISMRYNNFDVLEDGYGLNLRALAVFAGETYKNDECAIFMPQTLDDNIYDPVDAKLHKENYNAYYHFSEKPEICGKILEMFGLDPQRGHIINGHVPVKIKNGESPVKADGRLFVIDGGISKAYQKATGIAGYTLIYDSHSLNLAEHKPFIAGESEHTPEIHMVERLDRRANISDTDKGRELLLQINDLRDLLDAYRSGDIKEGYKVF